MKEKVNQFAKGIFEYETPKLVLSSAKISLSVSARQSKSGSFVVCNSFKTEMKGVLASDCHFLTFADTVFQGRENVVQYEFDAGQLQPGEVVRGVIHVITECGSAKLPVSVHVKAPVCSTAGGDIKDLYQFTKLAKEDGAEAARVFRNADFEEIFLFGDTNAKSLYRGLIKSAGRGQALEEFLIAMHKKLRVKLSVDKTSFFYEHCGEQFQDMIKIKKDNWGYEEIHIQSDSPFLIPEHKIIWTDGFLGEEYPLSFVVNPKHMLPGNNYGRLTISTARQLLVVEVTAVKAGSSHEKVLRKVGEKKCLAGIIGNYLDFCMEKISKETYIGEIGKLSAALEKAGKPLIGELLRLHMGIMDVDEKLVKDGFERLEQMSDLLRESEPVLFCAYQYLRGLWSGEAVVRQDCLREVRRCFEQQDSDWRIFWFLLYLDPGLESPRRKYEIICEQLRGDCHSPVMYFEICSILNENPSLLQGLEPGVMQCLHWGCKNQYMEKETALRYVYLAGKQKLFSRIIFGDMEALYEQYPEDEILTVICKMLMYGQMTSAAAFRWYALGLEKNLKITDLFEYYMYSLDETQEIHLTKSVLLYFLYDNHLTMAKKAMLYCYVIRQKEKDPETYLAYRDVMEEFAFKQLREGRISANLAVLYEEFINEENINEEVAKCLPKVMFTHEITCFHPDIVGVYVRHQELQGEEFYPLVQGKAVISVFTEQAKVFLADSLDNRYYETIDYTDNKMLQLNHLAENCFEKNQEDKRLLLHLYDRFVHLHSSGERLQSLRSRILKIEDLDAHTWRKIFAALLRDYYDNFEGEQLDLELLHLDWEKVSASQRAAVFEYCAVRSCTEKAMEGILKFGYDRLPAKRILKVSTNRFHDMMSAEDATYVKLAWYIFRHGYFDENLLAYLCNYYNGALAEMVQIWEAVHTFGLSVEVLAERILAQALFTEEFLPELFAIYYDYYENGTNRRLCRGFLNYMAYRNLVHNMVLPERFYGLFYREVRVQENLPCLIAVLRYYSRKDTLTEEECSFCGYNVNQLYQRGIVLPCFRDFSDRITLPRHLLDEHYVSYTANPKYELKIHYRILTDGVETEYITETMHDAFEGIRVQKFVLFQDETLQYYITECRPEGDVTVKEQSVRFDEMRENSREESHYRLLNLMMIAREMGDEAALHQMMLEYAGKQESAKKMFVPL